MSTTRIAVFCQAHNPALKFLPRQLPHNVDLVIGTQPADFPAPEEIKGLVVVPPTDNAVLSETVFPMFRNMEWVHSFSAGVDALSGFITTHLADGKDFGHVPLTNGRGAFSSSLGEYVMCSALHFNKQINRCVQNRTEKKWDKFEMNVLSGKTMGFLGYGHIAQTSARMAKHGFGMKVAALRNRTGWSDPEGVVDQVFAKDDALELFKSCDFVVSTLPGTKETHNFVSHAHFDAMKSSAVFISCGRGTVVDEDALEKALKSNSIAGAALDVFQVEPLPESSTLWDCPNLLLTAHNADYTEDYCTLGWNVWLENLHCFQEKKPMATLVNKEKGY